MKWNLIFAATITLFMANANATSIDSIKSINHKEWFTGSLKTAKLTFKKLTPDPLALKKMQDHIQHTQPKKDLDKIINATAYPQDISIAPVGYPSLIPGVRNLLIWNQSTSIQTYNVVFSICVLEDQEFLGCANTEDRYEVSANGGMFSDQMENMLQYTFDDPGNYTAETAVSVNNEDGTEIFSTFSSQDITVPAK